MKDILIPYIEVPTYLKYVLRSIKKHAKGIGKIWIVGDKPKFIKDHEDIIYLEIPKTDCGDNKAMDVWWKVYQACKHGISDEFILFASDYFLTDDVDFTEFQTRIRPYPLNFGYDKNGEVTKCTTHESNGYRKLRAFSARWLDKKGLPTKNYDLHCPMPMERDKVIELSNKFPFLRKNISGDAPYVIKSSYGNYFKVEGLVDKDNKIMFEPEFKDSPKITKSWFFSIGHFIDSEEVFEDLYPEKCEWEKTREKKEVKAQSKKKYGSKDNN